MKKQFIRSIQTGAYIRASMVSMVFVAPGPKLDAAAGTVDDLSAWWVIAQVNQGFPVKLEAFTSRELAYAGLARIVDELEPEHVADTIADVIEQVGPLLEQLRTELDAGGGVDIAAGFRKSATPT